MLKIPKIREIVYVSEGACTLKTYRVWRNHLYKEVYEDTLLGAANRHSAIAELETTDRYFADSFFETSSRQKIPTRNAIRKCFFGSMLLLELMPKPVSFNRPAPSGGEPGPKKPSIPRKLSKEEDIKDKKVEKAEYVINGERS